MSEPKEPKGFGRQPGGFEIRGTNKWTDFWSVIYQSMGGMLLCQLLIVLPIQLVVIILGQYGFALYFGLATAAATFHFWWPKSRFAQSESGLFYVFCAMALIGLVGTLGYFVSEPWWDALKEAGHYLRQFRIAKAWPFFKVYLVPYLLIPPIWGMLGSINFAANALNPGWGALYSNLDWEKVGFVTPFSKPKQPQEEVPEPVSMPSRTMNVVFQREDDGVDFRDLPDLLEWWAFVRAIVNDAAEFTEDDARRYRVPVTLNGKWGVPGFREARDILMDPKVNAAGWRDGRKNKGIEIYAKGWEYFVGYAEQHAPEQSYKDILGK